VKINYKAAALWYRRAADQEFPDAESNLGTMFYNGKGAPQSYEEAVKWFRLAAAQGFPDALFNLGHENGVSQDYDAALLLYRRAATEGPAAAAAKVEELAPPAD